MRMLVMLPLLPIQLKLLPPLTLTKPSETSSPRRVRQITTTNSLPKTLMMNRVCITLEQGTMIQKPGGL